MMEVKNVPAEAFKLKASAIEFNAVEGGEADTYEISMLARSAGAIEHWYWGEQVVHDMAGMNVAGKIPIDFNHEAEVIGYLDKFEETEDGLRVTGKLVSFQPDDRAAEIAFKARQGVPWQASINFGGDGIKVEQVAEGETTQANGREFSGPATVIRSWPLRGVAVTPYGADSNTQSTVLSDDGEQAVTFFNQEGQAMADEQATVEAEEQAEEAAVETCGECGSELDNDNNAESNDDAEQVEATAETSDELDDEPESDDEAVEAAAVVVPATEVGAKRKRPAAAECTPATKVASQHALRSEDAVVEHGVAYINVAVRVPVGMRFPTSVTVEWAP